MGAFGRSYEQQHRSRSGSPTRAVSRVRVGYVPDPIRERTPDQEKLTYRCNRCGTNAERLYKIRREATGLR